MLTKPLILATVVAIAAASVAVIVLATRGDEESDETAEVVTEFAPVRAYAGFSIDHQGFDGSGAPAVVARVGSPAQQAGLVPACDR
jgi:hypothetical protein